MVSAPALRTQALKGQVGDPPEGMGVPAEVAPECKALPYIDYLGRQSECPNCVNRKVRRLFSVLH